MNEHHPLRQRLTTVSVRAKAGAAVAVAAILLIGFAATRGSAERPEPPRLSASADVGRALDREGVAARRAVLADRWGPVEEGTPLEVGDWLEVGTRGANALRVRLAGGGELILGPGALVELAAADRLQLLRGEMAVDARKSRPIDISGPGDATHTVDERTILRARDGALARLDQDPRWLVGYESNASTEALGSLLANVDGRNVPLTIGYHKVTVDVRDQIARTVIEESFLNHTSSVLEGVFYFPLPADASISGFGMWIGNELVQGEIVEKQRAREIYETILRERRDPGLLEWTGGNIFKARVFPIGHEKRIRIAYTQVLPKRGEEYTYHYGLESELLRANPLGRLEITVNVASAEPLVSVEVPSHECRIRQAEHSAVVEFAAEEFAPERDFELRIRARTDAGGLTVIPHRRADDGYFMLLVDAPEASRTDAGNTEPLELLILADTSGSSWGPGRARQIAFVEALIAALGDDDTYNLATCDVETRWVFERPAKPSLAHRERALEFLEARDPLGWSNLTRAFESAFERAGAGTQVVYVGDGVPTTGDADPVAFAHQLARSYPGRGTFHAVAPGSSSEQVVMRAIAALGGGSLRAIGGGTDPAQAAFGLLQEITTPAVVDLELTFEGLPVAAVYPEVLPNLPAGGQHVVVGRFDPTGGDLAGRIVVTGTLDGREVRLETETTIAGDDEGNSFIPRLWARHHLDHLLDQGRSPAVHERIVVLSEDFQIATPYTSFLVLESDADRERFGVKKRFRMRDAEEFFAEGRATARHELLKEQMLKARSWRQRMHAQVLASFAEMGRELTELLRGGGPVFAQSGALGYIELDGVIDRQRATRFSESSQWNAADSFGDHARAPKDGNELLGEDEEELGAEEWVEGDGDLAEMPAAEPALEAEALSLDSREYKLERRAMHKSSSYGLRQQPAGMHVRGGRSDLGAFRPAALQYGDAFAQLFPQAPPRRASAPGWTWSDDVVAVLARLDRRRAMAASELGWSIEIATTFADVRGRQQTARGRHLIGRDRWLVVDAHVQGNAYLVQWMDESQRGLMTEGWRLGRVRPVEEGDADAWPAPFAWHFGDNLSSFVRYDAVLERLENGRARVELSLPTAPANRMTLLIDVERGLVLEQSWSVNGAETRGLRFADFHQAGGLWWPGTVRAWNADGRGESIKRVRVQAPESAKLARLVQAERDARQDAIVLDAEQRQLVDAKQAARAGDAGLEERWLLLRHYAATQRWDAAQPHLDAIADAVGERPGLVMIRTIYLQQSRRHEELRQLLLGTATELAAASRDADHTMGTQLLQNTQVLGQGNELIELLGAIHPVFTRQQHVLDAELDWDQRWLTALANMQRPEELFQARARAAKKWPHVQHVQLMWANALAERGQLDQALAWLETTEAEHGPWQPHEVVYFRRLTLELLWNGYRLEQLIETVEAWERAAEVALGQSTPEQRTPEQRALAQGALDQNAYNRFLSALIYTDREEDAWQHMRDWLALAGTKRTPVDTARLSAAVQHALGQGHGLYHQRLEDERAELLARTARALVFDDASYLASSIVHHWHFRSTDAGLALLAELFQLLDAELETLPAQRLQTLVTLLRGAAHRLEDEDVWQPIIARVFERWLVEEDETGRAGLLQIVLANGSIELQIRAYEKQMEEADTGAMRAQVAANFYRQLLQQPWTEAIQSKLIALLPELVASLPEPVTPRLDQTQPQQINLDQAALALYDLVEWAQRTRTEAIVTALEGYESMTRRTLASERAKALREVRERTTELLAGLERTLEPAALRDWAAIERTYLLVENGHPWDETWSRAFNLLIAQLEAFEAIEDPELILLRDRVLAQRALVTCSHLLVRADANAFAEHGASLRAVLERLIETELEFPSGRAALRDLLIALDRGDELAGQLEAWFEGGGDFAKMRWGSDWSFVLAERGELERAVAVLEEIDRVDELTPAELESLAGWYTALDQPERSRLAKIRGYEVMDENQLANDLYRRQRSYQRSGDAVPAELDPEIPVRFTALMQKTRDPQSRFHLLRGYYEATKDFRLLECLPAAVIGHSAQAVYPFLGQVGSLAQMIDEEATVDRIQQQLSTLYESAATDVDRRGLRLLEFQIVLRAARQAHGTERHAERSLHALVEAFRGEWADGELVMMAEFLAGQGRLEPTALASERLRQLRALRHMAEDADERLRVAYHLARVHWLHDERDAAVRVLGAAIDERRAPASGRLPQSAHDELAQLSSWHVSMRSLQSAEALWLAELEHGHTLDQVLWLKQQLYAVWRDAVLLRAEVSLGAGESLYVAVVETMRRDLAERTNEHHAAQVVALLRDLWYRCHHELQLERVGGDVTDFAFAQLPEVMDLYQYRGGQSMVGQMAELLQQVRDPLTAFEFLVVRAENEPRWLRLQRQDFWSQHAWRFANLRSRIGEPPGVLEQRALAIVLAELREDLRTRQSRNRAIYDRRNSDFWTSKRAVFLETTLAFLAERRDSPHAIAWASEYLFHGLAAHDEAVTALTVAWRRGILHLEGRDQLGVFLQELERWDESIPVVAELVDERPAVARYRVMQIKAYFYTDDGAAAARALSTAETWMRAEMAWTEATIAELADGCLAVRFFADCARLFDEAIALHVRTAPGRGVGDGVLSRYYRQIAAAYSGLGQTAEAVDAAAGAIVSWGSNIGERNRELSRLVEVLAESRDLEGYVASLDQEVAATGLENPIVRKALGRVYLAHEELDRAAAQLLLARRARPNDVETHQLLLRVYQGMRRPELAADALLEWARTTAYTPQLYADLGMALLGLERIERSERAFTTMVELSPNESAGHQKLAEIREQQGRWEDAAQSWRHVTRIRSGEPTGYLGLARALVRGQRDDEARKVIEHLMSTSWPSHFGDVHRIAHQLLEEIEAQGRLFE